MLKIWYTSGDVKGMYYNEGAFEYISVLNRDKSSHTCKPTRVCACVCRTSN